ncbi:MAG: hypothetical protein R3E83_01430 [Burkholderiaceae bacterium]
MRNRIENLLGTRQSASGKISLEAIGTVLLLIGLVTLIVPSLLIDNNDFRYPALGSVTGALGIYLINRSRGAKKR